MWGYVFLTIDTRPGYMDTGPLPASAAKWKYKAIWRKDDTRVGMKSSSQSARNTFE